MVKVKICGLTNLEDAAVSCENGADLVGFLFAKESPRFTPKETVKDIILKLPKEAAKVGLFKDSSAEEVVETVKFCGLTHVQLHGSENVQYCRSLKEKLSDLKIIKTFKVADKIMGDPDSYIDVVDYYLFDTYHPEMMGGTGIKFNWDALKDLKRSKDFFLAGGLTPENVTEAIKAVGPYGVDTSSGVEEKVGEKSKILIKEFIKNAKSAR